MGRCRNCSRFFNSFFVRRFLFSVLGLASVGTYCIFYKFTFLLSLPGLLLVGFNRKVFFNNLFNPWFSILNPLRTFMYFLSINCTLFFLRNVFLCFALSLLLGFYNFLSLFYRLINFSLFFASSSRRLSSIPFMMISCCKAFSASILWASLSRFLSSSSCFSFPLLAF